MSDFMLANCGLLPSGTTASGYLPSPTIATVGPDTTPPVAIAGNTAPTISPLATAAATVIAPTIGLESTACTASRGLSIASFVACFVIACVTLSMPFAALSMNRLIAIIIAPNTTNAATNPTLISAWSAVMLSTKVCI